MYTTNLDVCILAGGYGTRLQGLWDKPKCLVPVGSQPLLKVLLKQIQIALSPNLTMLILGYKANEVIDWLQQTDLPALDLAIWQEDKPQGTATALRSVLPILKAPVLILNGDTLPKYNLSGLLDCHSACNPAITAAWHKNCWAGAAVFSASVLHAIETGQHRTNLDSFIYGLLPGHIAYFDVPGFLDVGTPEGFEKARTWRV